AGVDEAQVLLVTVTRVAESGGQGLLGLAIHAVGHLFGEVAVFVAHRDDVAEPVVVEVVTALRPAVVGRTVAALDLGEAFASSEYPVTMHLICVGVGGAELLLVDLGCPHRRASGWAIWCLLVSACALCAS